jgi:hypothetical protein
VSTMTDRRPRGRPARIRLATVICVALVAVLLGQISLPQTANAATCPCSIWSSSAVPGRPSEPDTAAVEVGTKFRSDVDGYVTGVRFYKGTGNTGTHVGHLWATDGRNLGTVTFAGETASGWQQATFAAPVGITANTTYIVSYYAPTGHYADDGGFFATRGVDNAPLHALQDGVDGANGVYRYGLGGGFPTNTWQSSNYWVDVVFNTAVTDTTPPTVTGTSPVANATGVPAGTTVSATLSEPIQAGSAQLALTAGGGAVAGSTTYDAATRRVTFTPNAPLAASTVHTATVSGATDPSGNTMSAFSWSFSTAAANACPCTIWPDSAVPAVTNVNDTSAVELGVRFRTSTAGYITGLRFYKGSGNTGTHTGSLWTNTGSRLAGLTFTGETASGWQTVSLPAPVQVAANTTYVASYHTDVGSYSATNSGFASSGVSRGPLTALADGANGPNGVYLYGGGGFPTNTFQSTNYWVDVVFNTTATDTTAPVLTVRAPAPNAVGVSTSAKVTATFSEPVTASSITMTLTGPSGSVPGTVAYDPATSTATFTPTSPLATSTSYTAAVSGARDAAGNVMAPVSWSFTTAAPPPPPPDQGPGGPVLVIKSSSTSASQFSPFAAEILRTEGLNEFATADLSTVTASMLSGYDTVLLGSTPLTASQVSMLTTWVTGGGNLIAFRPDKQLAALLGLTSTTGTLAEGYVKVDTTTAPGAGITNQTIQFHGTADRYTLNGARAVATLYSNATTATSNPAVSLVNAGTSGGQAAAFTYDLPQSIVYTRQGNPAWEKLERDSQAPIRSDDLYFGGSSTDWVNLGKASIPQADEQQRLLANLIGTMNLDRKPLPRFWYFPRSAKALVVATGDDHANGGTAGRFDQYAANSLSGCVVDNWECLRFASYVYPNTPLSDAQARAYNASGFEVGLHQSTDCANFTTSSLQSGYATQLSQWGQKYASLPRPTTNRTHCIVWSDWSSQPTTEGANGITLDTNYYYWPGSWVTDRPGFMTGSGMPMRFTDKTGKFIDVYQAATQMTDESNQSYPFTPNSVLDAATGPLGYYGAFTANMHTDNATTFEDDQLLASAMSHGVPMVSARQLLAWVNGRNASSYSGISWNANTLSFTVNVGTGAGGLTGMVPTLGRDGTTLSALTRGGSPVSFTKTTIKGVEYAMFLTAPGGYTATYATSAAAPAVSTATVEATTATSATLRVDSTSATRTEIAYGTGPTKLTARVNNEIQGASRTLTLGRLKPATTYYYQITVTSPSGTTTTSSVKTLTTPAVDAAAPVVSEVNVRPLPDRTAAVRWKTDENTDATLFVGPRPDSLVELYDDERDNMHTVVVTKLRPDTTYYYRIRSVDAAGNATVWPAPSDPPARFVSAAVGVADLTAAQFRTTNGAAAAYVQQDDLGELTRTPADGAEFDRGTLPPSWDEEAETPTAATKITRGKLYVGGKHTGTKDKFTPDRTLEFRATFAGSGTQQVGWAKNNGNGNDNWAMFSLENGTLYAVQNIKDRQAVPLDPGLIGTAHVYRIDWSGSGFTYWVDGNQVAAFAASEKSLRARARDAGDDDTPLILDWMRVSADPGSADQVSRVLDAHQMVTWDRLTYRADVPANSSLQISIRTGNSATPDSTWSAWTPVGNGGRVDASSRYLQYRVDIVTRAPGKAPVLRDVEVTNNGTPFNPPTETGP